VKARNFQLGALSSLEALLLYMIRGDLDMSCIVVSPIFALVTVFLKSLEGDV